MSLIKNILISSRLIVSLISGMITLLFLVINKQFISGDFVLHALSIVLITGSGFLFNDVYDYKKDKLAGKQRPICTDALSKKQAIVAAVVLIVISLLLSFRVNNVYPFVVNLVTSFGVIFYSPFSKKYSVFKGLFVAILCCAPILLGAAVVNSHLSFFSLITVIVFITGREILLDVYDFEGDNANNRKTIPFYFGKSQSFVLSWALMYLGSFFLILFSNYNLIVIGLGIFNLIMVIFCSFLSIKKENIVVNITRILMFLSSISLSLL